MINRPSGGSGGGRTLYGTGPVRTDGGGLGNPGATSSGGLDTASTLRITR